MPVPRSDRGSSLPRIWESLGPFQMYVQMPALHTTTMFIQVCVRLHQQLQVSYGSFYVMLNSYIGVKRSGHFMWKMGFIAGQYIFSKKSLILPTTAAHLATLNAQFQYNDEKLSDKSNYCVQEKWNKLFAL